MYLFFNDDVASVQSFLMNYFELSHSLETCGIDYSVEMCCADFFDIKLLILKH